MKKGSVYHKIKNWKHTKKQVEVNDTNEVELKEFLKYCVVHKDKTKLKEVLRDSITLRRNLLKDEHIDFKEFWMFYFIDPELVKFISIDYSNLL